MRRCTYRDCGNELRPNARFCPHCGRKVRRDRAVVGFLLLAGVGSILLLMFLARSGHTVSTPAPVFPSDDTGNVDRFRPTFGPHERGR